VNDIEPQGYIMNQYSIPTLLSSIAFLILAIATIKNQKFSSKNNLFSFLCILTCFWQGTWAVLFNISDKQSAYFLVKLGYSWIIFLPIVYYHFSMAYVDRLKQEKNLIAFLYLLGFVFLGFNWFSNYFISGYYEYYWGYYPKAGFLHLFYLGILIVPVFLRVTIIYYYEYKKENIYEDEKNKIGYAILGLIVYSFAALDFIVNYGFEFYPAGYIFILISLSIYSYAIVRHKMLDIKVVIKRTFIFSAILTFIVFIVGIVSTLLPLFLLQFFGYVLKPFWLSLCSVSIVSLVLFPLHRFLVGWTDRFLFQKKLEYGKILEKFTNRILGLSSIDEIANITVTIFSDLLRATNCYIWIKDVEDASFVLKACKGEGKRINLSLSSPLIKYFHNHLGPVCRNSLPEDIDYFKELTSLFDDLYSEICFPLFVQDNLLGVLSLGKKKSDDLYVENDIGMLKGFCGALAMSISNAILQIALAEIKTLKGIVPICSNCKKIRDDRGYWNLLESYLEKYSEASFSHGMCPECADELYGKEDWYIDLKNEQENGKGGRG
jgi:histidine kinase-like protein/GAF domain-containing protein